MSFYKYPGKLYLPNIPNISILSDVWYSESGLLNVKVSEEKYIISDNLIGNILCDNGIELKPVYRNVNGYIYWKAVSEFNTLYLYYDTISWVLSNYLGVSPDSTIGGYRGTLENPFSTNSFSFSPVGLYAEENSVLENSNRPIKYFDITATWKWDWWESQTFVGEYINQKNPSDKKYVGYPQWKDEEGNTYVCVDGAFSNISYNEELAKWIIGTYESEEGWWEGSKPSKDEAVFFIFVSLGGSEVVKDNKLLTFSGYVMGEEFLNRLMCEVATWK